MSSQPGSIKINGQDLLANGTLVLGPEHDSVEIWIAEDDRYEIKFQPSDDPPKVTSSIPDSETTLIKIKGRLPTSFAFVNRTPHDDGREVHMSFFVRSLSGTDSSKFIGYTAIEKRP